TGAALSSQGTSSGTPQLLVTVKKLKNFRGADVQLLIQARDYSLTDAWKFAPGSCADGEATFWIGGRGGTYPSAFAAVPNLSVPQNQEYVDTDECLTPHGTGLLWLSAGG